MEQKHKYFVQNIKQIYKMTTIWVKYFVSLAHEIDLPLNCQCYLTRLTE